MIGASVSWTAAEEEDLAVLVAFVLKAADAGRETEAIGGAGATITEAGIWLNVWFEVSKASAGRIAEILVIESRTMNDTSTEH